MHFVGVCLHLADTHRRYDNCFLKWYSESGQSLNQVPRWLRLLTTCRVPTRHCYNRRVQTDIRTV
jgi:hypothetical protein